MKKRIIIILTTVFILLNLPCISLLTGKTYAPLGSAIVRGLSKKQSVKQRTPRIRLKSGEKKITISWNKIRHAGGYQIYRSVKKAGKFKRIATVRKAGRAWYVNKGLKTNRSYYYKVRAFRKTADGYCFSRFSAVKRQTPRTKLQIRTDAFIRKATKPSMTKRQKLRACYKYMRDHYRYINRAVVETGATGWVNRYASRFFKDKGGNCCSWAAAYTTAAKRLGFPAKAISGKIYYANGALWGRHGWTEIKIDGKTFVFDPEIESSYRRRGTKINLYQIDGMDNGWFLYKKK